MFYYIISNTYKKKLETYFALLYFWTFAQCVYISLYATDPGNEPQLESVQDFLFELDMKPHTHFFLNYQVIVRPVKIKNRADKNWAHF